MRVEVCSQSCSGAATALALCVLILCGISPARAADEDGFFSNTPLEDAIRGADVTATKIEIQRGGDANQVGSRGLSMLMWASRARTSAPELVDLLLAAGADANTEDEDGLTALFFAVRGGQNRTVESLLAAGAEADRMQANSTALHQAVLAFRLRMIEMLVTAGADPDRQDARGQTAAEMARASVGSSVLLIAIERGTASRFRQ